MKKESTVTTCLPSKDCRPQFPNQNLREIFSIHHSIFNQSIIFTTQPCKRKRKIARKIQSGAVSLTLVSVFSSFNCKKKKIQKKEDFNREVGLFCLDLFFAFVDRKKQAWDERELTGLLCKDGVKVTQVHHPPIFFLGRPIRWPWCPGKDCWWVDNRWGFWWLFFGLWSDGYAKWCWGDCPLCGCW